MLFHTLTHYYIIRVRDKQEPIGTHFYYCSGYPSLYSY